MKMDERMHEAVREGAPPAGGRSRGGPFLSEAQKEMDERKTLFYVLELYEPLAHRVSALIRAAFGVVIGPSSAICVLIRLVRRG